MPQEASASGVRALSGLPSRAWGRTGDALGPRWCAVSCNRAKATWFDGLRVPAWGICLQRARPQMNDRLRLQALPLPSVATAQPVLPLCASCSALRFGAAFARSEAGRGPGLRAVLPQILLSASSQSPRPVLELTLCSAQRCAHPQSGLTASCGPPVQRRAGQRHRCLLQRPAADKSGSRVRP